MSFTKVEFIDTSYKLLVHRLFWRARRVLSVRVNLPPPLPLPSPLPSSPSPVFLSPWQHLPLTVHFLSSEHAQLARRACPQPPEQIVLETGTMDDLKRVVGATFGSNDDDDDDDDDDGDGGDREDEDEDDDESLMSVSHLAGRGGGGGVVTQ